MKNIILVLLAVLIFPEFQIQGQATSLFDEDTVSIVRDEGHIYGSLVVPYHKKTLPVALIISGSGNGMQYAYLSHFFQNIFKPFHFSQ